MGIARVLPSVSWKNLDRSSAVRAHDGACRSERRIRPIKPVRFRRSRANPYRWRRSPNDREGGSDAPGLMSASSTVSSSGMRMVTGGAFIRKSRTPRGNHGTGRSIALVPRPAGGGWCRAQRRIRCREPRRIPCNAARFSAPRSSSGSEPTISIGRAGGQPPARWATLPRRYTARPRPAPGQQSSQAPSAGTKRNVDRALSSATPLRMRRNRCRVRNTSASSPGSENRFCRIRAASRSISPAATSGAWSGWSAGGITAGRTAPAHPSARRLR